MSTFAVAATVEAWGRRVRDEARRVQRDDGLEQLERQRRATRLSTWVDPEGMWNLRGRFDPVTGVKSAAKLDTASRAEFVAVIDADAPGADGPVVEWSIPVEIPARVLGAL